MKGLLSKVIVLAEGLYSSTGPAKYAIALAKTFGTEVIAAYAVDTAAIRHLAMSRIFIDEESEEYERSLEDTGRRRLAFVEELGRAKGVKIATFLLKGSIAGEVLRLAEETGADCILLGGWEHNRDFRDIIIEANREIANLAPCSVLFVKSRDAELVYGALAKA
jgi:nucleotide-binding universal stress UspA family protein